MLFWAGLVWEFFSVILGSVKYASLWSPLRGASGVSSCYFHGDQLHFLKWDKDDSLKHINILYITVYIHLTITIVSLLDNWLPFRSLCRLQSCDLQMGEEKKEQISQFFFCPLVSVLIISLNVFFQAMMKEMTQRGGKFSNWALPGWGIFYNFSLDFTLHLSTITHYAHLHHLQMVDSFILFFLF